ncbi:MAG: hypothetical protein QM713_01170 [Arachnia sp.]
MTRGLPDFGAPLSPGGYEAFDQPGGVVALPDALLLATRPDGVPRLTLERFRSSIPGSQAYGLVSAWFTLSWAEDCGDRLPTAFALPVEGTLSVGLDRVDAEPEPLGTPMSWDGSLAAPWGARVTPEQIVFMTTALTERWLSLSAAATLLIRGVAPRLPVVLTVDAERLARLVPTPDRAALTAVVAELVAPSGILTVRGEARPEEIAQVVIDRLNSELPAPSGVQSWDLVQPFVTRRRLDLALSLREQLSTAPFDEAAMIPPGTDVPAIQLGWQSIDVLSNLPPRPVGVLAHGVNMVAAANPPSRPQASVAGCELTDEPPRQTVTLRLAPLEPLAYDAETWMIVSADEGVYEAKGEPRHRTEQRLILGSDDFGVAFAHLSADPALLGLASIEARVVRGPWQSPSAVLTADAPEAAFVLPAHEESSPLEAPQLVLRATATAGGATIDLPPLPAAHTRLGLPSLPGWGRHEVLVRNDGTEPVAVELADEPGTVSDVLSLAPGGTRTWSWVALDPFRPGFRYRLRPVGDPGPWQGPLTAAELPLGSAS